jgi:hypothetical protein
MLMSAKTYGVENMFPIQNGQSFSPVKFSARKEEPQDPSEQKGFKEIGHPLADHTPKRPLFPITSIRRDGKIVPTDELSSVYKRNSAE